MYSSEIKQRYTMIEKVTDINIINRINEAIERESYFDEVDW